jgi:Ca2+-binding RTX toxin-like protein
VPAGCRPGPGATRWRDRWCSAPVGPLSGAGANTKPGSAGIDKLAGSAFGHRLLGLAGNDVLSGRAGHDCLSGGPGNDRLSGGSGRNRLRGGAGNDTINSRDGRRETVRCGTGTGDRVRADRSDRLIGSRLARRRRWFGVRAALP